MYFFERVFFSVLKKQHQLVLEKIDPADRDESKESFKNSFSDQALSDIALRCCTDVPEDTANTAFSTVLNEKAYTISLVGRFESVFIFLAEELSDITQLPKASNFLDACNIMTRGVFFWRIKDTDIRLAYANSSYYQQSGLSGRCLHKSLDDIFSPKKATLIRSQIERCLHSEGAVSYLSKFNKKLFGITLYPQFKNGRVFRILGVSTDITKALDKFIQTEQMKESASQYEMMLQECVRYERILSQSAREFLDTGLFGFNDCIEKLVINLGQLYDADWAFACKDRGALCGISSQWMASAEADRDRLFNISGNHDFYKWVTHIRAGRLIVANDIHSELPGLYNALKGAGSPDVRSFIAVPVLRADEFWGMLCVASFRQKRIWSAKEIGGLKTAAEIIMSAYLRTKTEKQLSESNRVLAEYDECLQDILSVQESLCAVSRRFLTADTKEFSGCVSNMLGVLSELTEIDHASIIAINGDIPQCFAWHKKGMSFQSYKHRTLGFDVSAWVSYLGDSDHIALDDFSSELYSLPSFVLEHFLDTGIKSLLIVPIRSGNTIIAVLSLAKVLGVCRWDNTPIHAAQQFGSVFLDAYLKHLRQLQLINESKYDIDYARETLTQATLIKHAAESAQLLIDSTSENLFCAYRTVCESIARHFPIYSINLTRYSQDASKSHVIFKWHEKGDVSSVNQSDGDKYVVLSIPVYYRDAVWGCLLVNIAYQSPSDGFIRILEMISQGFARAYMRIYPDKKESAIHAKHAVPLSSHSFSSHCTHSPVML